MRRGNTLKPSFETLEGRVAPAVYLVNSVQDPLVGQVGQLRFEIAAAMANNNDPNPTILIDLSRYGYGRTIRLNQGPILVTKNITIVGTQGVSIWGERSNGIPCQALNIQTDGSSVSATISGVSFFGCQSAAGNGGAIFLRGNLTLNSCTFINNSASVGGAVDVQPTPFALCTVAITGCTFTNNSAGSGGAVNIEPNNINGGAEGATVTVNTSVFQNNRTTTGAGAAIQDTGTFQTFKRSVWRIRRSAGISAGRSIPRRLRFRCRPRRATLAFSPETPVGQYSGPRFLKRARSQSPLAFLASNSPRTRLRTEGPWIF